MENISKNTLIVCGTVLLVAIVLATRCVLIAKETTKQKVEQTRQAEQQTKQTELENLATITYKDAKDDKDKTKTNTSIDAFTNCVTTIVAQSKASALHTTMQEAAKICENVKKNTKESK